MSTAREAAAACTCPREAIDCWQRDLLTHRPECPRFAAEPPSGAHLRVDVDADRREARDRARTVSYLLERCSQELERLERIEHLTAGDVEALHSAAVSAARALRDLGRFQ